MSKKFYYFGQTGAGTWFKFITTKELSREPLGYKQIIQVNAVQYFLCKYWIDAHINEKTKG